MLTEEERNDLDSTLDYGDPFGGAPSQDLRRKLLGADSEARKFYNALELIETFAIDGLTTADQKQCLREIKSQCAKALRGEQVGVGIHRAEG